MALELLSYDSADHFRDAGSQVDLLNDALGSGDANYIKNALGIIARARGMTQLERDTGMKRQALYRALSDDGNPTLDTLASILRALKLSLSVVRDQFFVDRADNGRYYVGRRTIRKPAPLRIAGETMLYGVFSDRASAYRWMAALERASLPRPTKKVLRNRREAVREAEAATA